MLPELLRLKITFVGIDDWLRLLAGVCAFSLAKHSKFLPSYLPLGKRDPRCDSSFLLPRLLAIRFMLEAWSPWA